MRDGSTGDYKLIISCLSNFFPFYRSQLNITNFTVQTKYRKRKFIQKKFMQVFPVALCRFSLREMLILRTQEFLSSHRSLQITDLISYPTNYLQELLERFWIECLKTKTNSQSNEGKYLKEPIRTQSKTTKLSKARENAGDQVVITFSFASDWMREWLQFSWPITVRRKGTTMKPRITFDQSIRNYCLELLMKKLKKLYHSVKVEMDNRGKVISLVILVGKQPLPLLPTGLLTLLIPRAD